MQTLVLVERVDIINAFKSHRTCSSNDFSSVFFTCTIIVTVVSSLRYGFNRK